MKNIKYKLVKDIISREAGRQYMRDHEGRFLQYHNKEVKFIVRGDLSQSISFELASIMKHFSADTMVEFWTYLLSNYNFLPALTS